MMYFKNKTGEVFAYESQAAREQFGPADLVAMTTAEVDAHINPPPAPLTAKDYSGAAQAHLDSAAQSLGYDDIKTAVTYADEPAVPKFQADGQALRAWRSLVWAQAYATLDAVEAGEREQPTIEQFIAELPEFVLQYD